MSDTRTRIRAAVDRRFSMGLGKAGETTIYRLVHDRQDDLPDLAVDRFGDVVVARLRSERWRTAEGVDEIADGLAAAGFPQVHVVVDELGKHDPRRLASLEAELNAHVVQRGFGVGSRSFDAFECGHRFGLSLDEGFSQGIYVDMREPRRDLAARWEGRRVLNLFAYTCAFGVYLAPRNRVLNVDVSQKALDWGRRNYERNGLDVRDESFVEADVFDWLDAAVEEGRRFEAIILDPPAYSRGKRNVSREFSVRKDLGWLVERAWKLLSREGEMFVSTNLASLPRDGFRRLMIGIAADRSSWLDRMWDPPPDFPVTRDHYHLKAALLRPRRREDTASPARRESAGASASGGRTPRTPRTPRRPRPPTPSLPPKRRRS